jgi:hypothetical protein
MPHAHQRATLGDADRRPVPESDASGQDHRGVRGLLRVRLLPAVAAAYGDTVVAQEWSVFM